MSGPSREPQEPRARQQEPDEPALLHSRRLEKRVGRLRRVAERVTEDHCHRVAEVAEAADAHFGESRGAQLVRDDDAQYTSARRPRREHQCHGA
eukprot:6929813-Prymnesium_polylepis.2